ncbi:MAG: XrtA system polysaccharide deacetylase [Nitrospirota bacterium]|nr:XrtA system polysaccharide deacetylase [Nitrospirota bacterium]
MVTGQTTQQSLLHCMSIDVEEHFQVAAFDNPARRNQWHSMESRVERNIELILTCLEECQIRSTMFVLGWVGERYPRLVRQMADAGHEIASHGYAHELVTDQTPEQFRLDVQRAKRVLEDVCGQPVIGYRAPTFSIVQNTLWALPILIEEGYAYDSSIFPVYHDQYGIPGANPIPHVRSTQSGPIWEIPPSTCKIGSVRLPVAGGGYFRILPYWLLSLLLRKIESAGQSIIFYLHPWEFDPEQPKMTGSLSSRLRHYWNLDKTEKRYKRLIRDFRFAPIREALPMIGSLYSKNAEVPTCDSVLT